MILAFISTNQMDSGQDTIGSIALDLGNIITTVNRVVHHTKMFPIILHAGRGMLNCKIRVSRKVSKKEKAFIAKGNSTVIQAITNHDFRF